MNKRIVALLSALILMLSVTSCGDVSEPIDSDGNTVQSSEISEEKKETAESVPDMPEIESVPIPDGGWTEETISEVIYINGKNVKLPCKIDDLGMNFELSSDYTIRTTNNNSYVTYQYEKNAMVEIGFCNYKNTNSIDNIIKGDVFSIDCNPDDNYGYFEVNRFLPISVNGVKIGSTVEDVEKNLDFDKNELGGWCHYRKNIGSYSLKIACKDNIVKDIVIIFVYE